MIEEKERYCFGNTFNNLAYDQLIKAFPELEKLLKRTMENSLAEVTNTQFRKITLPVANKKSYSIITCGKCRKTLDGTLLSFEDHIYKCGNCGYEFFEYNQRISQLDHTQAGIVYRALQGIEHYITHTIEEAFGKHLNQTDELREAKQ